MAKVPPKPIGKGFPPRPEDTVGNLDKAEAEDLVALNFKARRGFKKEFKMYAAQNNESMVRVLIESFDCLRSKVIR